MRLWSIVGIGVCLAMSSCASSDGDRANEQLGDAEEELGTRPVGLSLFFRNGEASPLTLVGNARRWLQEIDITASITTDTDQGIVPLTMSGELASLDWTGVTMVEEQWTPSADGTFTRERYYRNARWMERPSAFFVVAEDADGDPVGVPLVAFAGSDDHWGLLDDGFVRRFVARQIATGCAAVGDCSTATAYTAEGLVQLRDALKPELTAQAIPKSAKKLALYWTEDPTAARRVDVSSVDRRRSPYGYGFEVSLEPTSRPSNGKYYRPGDSVSFRVTFRDGEGNRLHPKGSLPTYGEFFAGQVTSGLRYLDLTLGTRLYYALKHRESNLLAVLSGPTNALTTPTTVVDPASFFGPEVPFATTAVDGYTAVGQTIPPAAVIFGGLQDPTLWNTPVSDEIVFTIPADAKPGTYVAAIKARREFGGEALNRGAVAEIQVGQKAPTSFAPKTRCGSCHSFATTDFDRILHGIDDRRTCFGCHASLGIEFDNAIDIRIHTIHDRSDRYPGDVHACSTCHVTAPTGPARGFLE